MDRLTSMGVFVKVVDCGGFSAAARRLGLSVTMVSNHVQALEERLGARLLNRTTRSVGLTETGRAYYERCTGILAEIEDADRAAGVLHSTPMGTLKLYTNPHIVRFLAPVIADYLRAYPAAAVDVTGGDRMVDLVEEGYDLAVRTFRPPESTLIVRNLSAWRHIVCVAPDYFATHPPVETLADLALHNCVRYAFYPFGDDWHFTGPDGKPAQIRVSGTLLSNTAEVLRVVALQGLGVFLAPSFLVEEDLQAGRLVEILPEWQPVEFTINAFYPHRHQLSSKVRIFIDLMAEHFARHRRWLDLTCPFQ
ncbi:MAG TPA: LysR family transcriptional regulator [Magnetospirillaceae bacterium]|nr:LysR family transcriptional regulator [Magnetospirillaceae bacterium]